MRRFETRDPAAFLVDEDRCVGSADAFPQVGNQCTDLLGALAIAREEDETEDIRIRKKSTFPIG